MPQDVYAALCCGAQSRGAAVADVANVTRPEAIKQGKRLYDSVCAWCHEVNLVNAGASSFDLRTFPLDQKARFVQSVLKGKGTMPAREGFVTPEEVEALRAYVGVRSSAIIVKKRSMS